MSNKVKTEAKSSTENFLSFAGAILIVLSIRWLLFEPYVIPSGSMLPTLLKHDHILVNKLAFGVRVPFTKQWLVKWGEVRRGDILVFRSLHDDGYFMIKRVIAVAGDRIEYTDKGELLVNDEKVPQELMDVEEGKAWNYPVGYPQLETHPENFDFYLEKSGEHQFRSLLTKGAWRAPFGPRTVSDGHLFMMGDNRDNSQDSRYWGELPHENVLGRAVFVWLSCDETFKAVSFLCDPRTIRWKRFFHGIE